MVLLYVPFLINHPKSKGAYPTIQKLWPLIPSHQSSLLLNLSTWLFG